MTSEQIKSALLDAIWGANNVQEAAAAVMALVGPRKLVWTGSESDCYMQVTTTTGVYCVGVFGGGWYAEFEPHNAPKSYSIGWHYDSAISAQAAAQSHADAAHWANTALGDMIGGE